MKCSITPEIKSSLHRFFFRKLKCKGDGFIVLYLTRLIFYSKYFPNIFPKQSKKNYVTSKAGKNQDQYQTQVYIWM